MKSLDHSIAWLKTTQVDPLNYSEEMYGMGLEILKAHSKNKAVIAQLSRGLPNTYKKRILYQHIHVISRKLLDKSLNEELSPNSQPTFVNQKKKEFTKSFSKHAYTPIEWELLPDTLKALSIQKGKNFSSAAKAHWELLQANFKKNPKDLSANQLRKNAEYAQTILDKISENAHIWEQLDYFQVHKQLKKDAPIKLTFAIEELSDGDLHKRLMNRRSNLCTYRKRMSQANSNTQLIAYESKIESLEKEIQALVDEKQKRDESK